MSGRALSGGPLRARHALALGLALAPAACADKPLPATSGFDGRTGCARDTECAGTLRCQLGACVADGTPEGLYALRIVPPTDHPAAPTEIHDLRFADGPLLVPELPIELPDRVLLVGHALTTDTPPIEVAVNATAFAQSAVTGEGAAIAGALVRTQGRARFTMSLTPCWPDLLGTCKGNVYTIRLTPDPTLLPPAEFRDVSLQDLAAVGEQERPFALPGPAVPPTLDGDVRLTDGTPLHGLTVYGIDETGQRATTEGTTGLDGSFHLRFWAHYAGRTLRILATSTDRDRPLPILVQPVTLPADLATPAAVRVTVPEFGSTFTAQGQVLAESGAAVPGAQIRLLAQLSAGPFEARALAGADGSFSVPLYPGEYTVEVLPQLGSGQRLLRTRLNIASAAAPLDLHLKPLIPVTGRVVWPDGTPLGKTLISARLARSTAGRPDTAADAARPPTRVVEGETDAQGTFTLLVDTGEQILTIAPTQGLGLPTVDRRFEVPIEAGLSVDLGEVSVVPAGVISLTVFDQRELPVVGATVQVWRTDTPQGMGPQKVAEGTTDTLGGISLRVPAEGAMAPDAN